MTKHYAVTITASRAEIDAETYARRLGKLLDRSPEELEEAIRGDTVIIERELSYSEAIEIQRELSRRRIPTQVSAGEDLSGQELWLRGEFFGAELDDIPNEPVEDEDLQDEDEEGGDERGVEEDESPAEDSAELSAWAELFPDLAEEELDEFEAEEQQEEDWASESFASGPLVVEKGPVQAGVEAAPVGGDSGAAGVGESGVDAASKVTGGSAVTEAPELMGAARVSDAPASEPEESSESGRFDAGKIHAAFSGGDSERPPYKPKGYDKRPEHVPLVAAVLSAVAPGAGQVFNGQPDKAQRYGWTFFLILPWIESVRQAMQYGEKVRTYYAPRPEPGAAKRALLYGVKWWVAIVLIVVVSTGLVSMIQDHQQEQAELRHQRALSHAVEAGTVYVTEGVRSGVEAADEVEIEEEVEEEDSGYTMDDEERAKRLFIVGYHYCKGENFAMCEQLMGRVTSLVTGNHDAYRLRTWAGLQQASPDPERKMPEVSGEVPTLEEFEMELAMEGKDLDDVDENFSTWWDVEGERRVEELNGDEESESDEAGQIEEEGDDEDDAWRQVQEAVEAE